MEDKGASRVTLGGVCLADSPFLLCAQPTLPWDMYQKESSLVSFSIRLLILTDQHWAWPMGALLDKRVLSEFTSASLYFIFSLLPWMLPWVTSWTRLAA